MAIKSLDLIAAGQGFQKVVWRDLEAGDEGSAFDSFANASGTGYRTYIVQVEGVLGGAEVSIVGSIIPEMFNVLETFAYADIKQMPAVSLAKPIITGGGQDTKVTVGLMATR